MRRLSACRVFTTALVFLLAVGVFPATAYYCAFDDQTCIDGVAQVSVSFQFDSISPAPLFFYYAFDGGFSYQNGSSAVKVAYWLHYDQPQITNYNQLDPGNNWTTEAALRVGNLNGYVGGTNNGCDGVWGNACSQNLISYLQSSMFSLSNSGVPYDTPLQTVLQPLTNNPNFVVPGCPSTLFQLNTIPSYVFINETTIVANNQSAANVYVAPSGSPAAPWRTWYTQGVTPQQQAQEVAVGIVARGPTFGSQPLNGPQDIQIELVCSRAPKQGRPPGPGTSDDHSMQGYARAVIKTYAFDDEFDYEDEVEADDYDEDFDDVDEDDYGTDYNDCSEETSKS